MNPVLAGVALVVAAGAVIAVSAREARAGLIGLAVTLVIAPFLAEPEPALTTLAARVVGAALTAYLLRAASSKVRDEDRAKVPGAGDDSPAGSRLGWPAEAAFALTAGIIGANVAAGMATLVPGGPGFEAGDLAALVAPAAVASAAGFALVVLGLVPTFTGAGALATTTGALILFQGVFLVRTGLAGPPGDLEQLAGVALLVGLGAAGAMLMAAESRRPTGVIG